MAIQRIVVDLIPGAKVPPVINASQYDNGRQFEIELLNGGEAYTPSVDMSIELHVKKRDGTIVVNSPINSTNNIITFATTEQMTACHGFNHCEVALIDDALVIGTANFILDVEKDPIEGGLTSESEIENLTQQIADIVPVVIGDDYYTKVQTDALLRNKADIEDLPDMSRYYNKYEVDNLLSNFVETSYLTTNYYSRSDSRSIFVSKGELQIAMQLEGQASGSIATFETAAPAQRLAALKCNFLCSGGNGTPSTPIPLVPYTELNVTNCGVNLCDEVWEVGNISGSNGQNYNDPDNIRSVNYIPIIPNKNYYLKTPSQLNIAWYDSNKTFLRMSYPNQSVITTSSDVAFFRIATRTYGSTYNNDIGINYPSTETAYHAYNADTITIDLDGTRYGGYVDANNGKLVVTHQVVDLGTLSWVKIGMGGGRYGFRAGISDMALTPAATVKINAVCECYSIDTGNNVYLGTVGMAGWGVSTHDIAVYDDTLESGDATAFKTAMNGMELAYELATPIEVDISPEYLNSHTGINNVFHDGNGTTEVKYKDTIQHYIDSRV